jgi:p-aminobenzoyl-glutamate transporter AbgT
MMVKMIGTYIAQRYESEEMTQGFDDGILSKSVMFNAYCGFDVIVTVTVPENDKKDSNTKKNNKNTVTIHERKAVRLAIVVLIIMMMTTMMINSKYC